MIQCNIINSSHLHGVKKLLFLGSSCIYPKFANQPIEKNEIKWKIRKNKSTICIS